MRQVILILLLQGIVLSLFLSALEETRRYRRYSSRDGLSQVTVRCMVQDRRGFMWFGTQDGLNRYDGYRFITYQPEDDNPGSISHIAISALCEDAEGKLWVGTDGGLNRYDPERETFTRFFHNAADPRSIGSDYISVLHVGPSGKIWVGTQSGGLNRWEPSTGGFTRFGILRNAHRTAAIPSVTAIWEDSAGTLWIGCRDGRLARWHEKNNELQIFSLRAESPLADGQQAVTFINEAARGELWAAGQGFGLIRLDAKTGAVKTRYRANPVNPASGPASDFISSAVISSGGELLLGANGGGISIFKPKSGAFSHIRSVPGDSSSLPDNHILSLYRDRSGLIWAGTKSNGAMSIQSGCLKFRHFRNDPQNPDSLGDNIVRAFAAAPDGSLWVGLLGGGLDRFSPERERVVHYRHNQNDPASLPSNVIRALYHDSRGELWIGSETSALTKWDREKNNFIHFPVPGSGAKGEAHPVTAILESHDHVLWLAVWGNGLNIFDREKATFTRINAPMSMLHAHSASSRWILAMCEDGKDRLWMGTVNGLISYQRQKNVFTCFCHLPQSPYSSKNFSVTSAYRDSGGDIWFGSIGGGLTRFNPKTEGFRVYKEKDGLPHNVIFGILPDNDENLWISGNKGLSRLNIASGVFRNYDEDDGLQSNEFTGGAAYRGESGELFFGGVNGFNAFFPQQVSDDPYIPQTAITGLKIFNKPVPVDPAGQSPLRRSITGAPSLQLPSSAGMFSFEFAALSFRNPHKNRYAYKMEGFDGDWVQAGLTRYATYTNLDPGRYVFRVKGSNADGVWNEQGVSLEVLINPPFWRSIWAYGLYGLLFLSLLYAVRRFELMRERGRVLIRESELRAQAAEAQARALEAEHSRKTHELEEARKLQLSMLPAELPQLPELDIATFMETATEVGGDYYDFHLDGRNTLAIAIGDATGHGLKAGTIVSVVKGLFCSCTAYRHIPAFLIRCNRALRRMRLGNLYMALTLLTIRERELSFCSAGMPPAYIYRPRTKSLEVIAIKNPPLGAFSENRYRFYVEKTLLEPGDAVFLLSDGLPELFDKNDRMLGYAAVSRLFPEACESADTAAGIIQKMESAVREWLGDAPSQDDITFVVIKIKNHV